MSKINKNFVRSVFVASLGFLLIQGLTARDEVRLGEVPKTYDSLPASSEKSLNVVYRLATLDDRFQMLSLYKNMTSLDEKKLIIIPEKFREEFLSDAIAQNRIFVAEAISDETKEKNIIAFVKLYCLTKRKESKNILENELHCIGNERKLQKHGHFKIYPQELENFSQRLPYVDVSRDDFEQGAFVYHKGQTYIYYGCSYTAPAYRRNHIGSKLDKYALEAVKQEVLNHMQRHNTQELLFIFGQVKDNVQHQSPIRSFTRFAQDVGFSLGKRDTNDCLHLRYWAYRALKPTFYIDGAGQLAVIDEPRENWEDFGCIVSYRLGEH